MSQENVEAFERGVEAFNNGDVEALIEEADPGVEFYDVSGACSAARSGCIAGTRVSATCSTICSARSPRLTVSTRRSETLGDRTIAIGASARWARKVAPRSSRRSGTIAQWRNGKVNRIRTYLDPEEALKAAGLRSRRCRRRTWSREGHRRVQPRRLPRSLVHGSRDPGRAAGSLHCRGVVGHDGVRRCARGARHFDTGRFIAAEFVIGRRCLRWAPSRPREGERSRDRAALRGAARFGTARTPIRTSR